MVMLSKKKKMHRSPTWKFARNHFWCSEQKTVRWIFPLQSPGDAAIFLWRAPSPDAFFASWQLHSWMIHLTNRPVFKCICSEEAVVFQTGTLWTADIFSGRESRQCKNSCLTFIEPPSWRQTQTENGWHFKTYVSYWLLFFFYHWQN